MIQPRRRGLAVQVNLMVQYWKRLGRSFLLLAHYVSVFGGVAARSVGWLVDVMEWAELLTRHTASVFECVHSKLRRLCRGRTAKIVSNHDTKSG